MTKSVGAVILDKNNDALILFQRKGKFWEFPKGKIQKGERFVQTLRREVFEETGIRKFVQIPGFRKTIYFRFRYHDRIIHRLVTYYLLKTNESVRISSEHLAFQWVSLSLANQFVRHKNYHKILEWVGKFLKNHE